jgi:hypothetical protein
VSYWVLMFGTAPLAFVPQAALGAVLVVSALRLLDFDSLWRYYWINKMELWLSVVTTARTLPYAGYILDSSLVTASSFSEIPGLSPG